jgi:hypothetical protein
MFNYFTFHVIKVSDVLLFHNDFYILSFAKTVRTKCISQQDTKVFIRLYFNIFIFGM